MAGDARDRNTKNTSFHGDRRLDSLRLEAFRLESGQDFLYMGAVSGLDRDIDLGALGRHIEEQPVVIDLEDVGAELTEPGRDLAQDARTIGYRQAERDHPLVPLELTHHDRGEDTRIDIAATENEPYVAAAEALGLRQHGGKPGGAGAFRHGLLQREIGVDRALERLLVDQHDFRNEIAHDRQRQRADILHRDAFGERGAAEWTRFAAQRIPERWIERRLSSDDLDRRLQGARRQCIPCNEPATADWDNDQIEIGGILQHLERNRALPGDHLGIVIGVDEGEPALARERLGPQLRIRNALAVQND